MHRMFCQEFTSCRFSDKQNGEMKLFVKIDLTDSEGNFVPVKFFGEPAVRLMGFTARQLIALEDSNDTSAIEALFAAVDVDLVRTLKIRVALNKFDGSFDATALN